ncbi:helix-turn-helix domain-containing protein [Streptomyces misionensis]|uniref:helix-turn-helix domain-containing protein n=1 Tax=Streptomyces misionensis TaxID=67331 RepID=UPI00340A7498
MTENGPAHAGEPKGASDPTKTFAARLDQLFREVHPAGRGPWTNAEAARAIGVSETYIGYLRKGARDNPTLSQMQALAAFFGIPVAYFVDNGEGETTRADIELLAQLKRMGVRQIALRTLASMSEDSVNSVLPVMQRLAETQAEAQGPQGRRMRPRNSSKKQGSDGL